MPVYYVARWYGDHWAGLNGGTDSPVFALAAFDDGAEGGKDLCVGGGFFVAGGTVGAGLQKWLGCAAPGTPFCAGDGTAAACPCANFGAMGHGCANSTGVGAQLSCSGSMSPDTVKFSADGIPVGKIAIFLQGTVDTSPGGSFGDGVRCIGGTLKRLYVKTAVDGTVLASRPGDPSITARSAAVGDPIPNGGTREYQTYYRDGNPSFCPPPAGSTFNITNGIKILWKF
jgi:hypothetical protein